jgi:small-conductance mechanosensitive channel
VPEILQRALEPKLVEAVGREPLRSVKVEFASASASSLDFAILADFSGEVASRANVLERLIHRTCVETCNEHGWVIPFTQVTVHQA